VPAHCATCSACRCAPQPPCSGAVLSLLAHLSLLNLVQSIRQANSPMPSQSRLLPAAHPFIQPSFSLAAFGSGTLQAEQIHGASAAKGSFQCVSCAAGGKLAYSTLGNSVSMRWSYDVHNESVRSLSESCTKRVSEIETGRVAAPCGASL
jgi:hypothetical protein